MKIVNLPAILFAGKWWMINRDYIAHQTPFFYPEEKKIFSIIELREILEEMEKMKCQ